MKKVYSIFIGLITGLVFLLCAFMPMIYSELHDSVSDERVEYAECKQVKFENELNLMEKLFLLRDGLRIEISESNTLHTAEEIITRTYEEIDMYRSMGMLELEMTDMQIEAEPMLFCYKEQVDKSNMFWLIHCIWHGGATISIWFDDATELPLVIDYSSDIPVYDKTVRVEYLEYLYRYYMDRTNLFQAIEESETNMEIMDYGNENHSELEAEPSVETKRQGLEMDYKVESVLYGELKVRFSVDSNGFFVNII